MSRRAKGRQPRTVPGGELGFLSTADRFPTDATVRIAVSETRPMQGQWSGLFFVR